MPPRRSARLNSTPDTEAKVLLHTDSRLISRPSTSSMNPSTTRPTKRAKQQKDQESPKVDDYRRIRGRRGYLKLMTEMPVDILLEIFSRVEPLDLLQLSRATKALRGIITSPNVAFLWKTVYENIPSNQRPPTCPSDLSPMLYTDLLYGYHCHFCASNQGKLVHWPGRVRSCYDCARKHFVKALFGETIHDLCSPWYFGHKTVLKRDHYILRAEYSRETQNWANLQGEEAKTKYKRDAQLKCSNSRSHNNKCREFQRQQMQSKLSSLQTLRNKRRADIIINIKQEGYGDELARSSSGWRGGIDLIPGVRRAAPLTNRAWQKLRVDVIGFLEDQRQEIRKNDMVHDYKKRIHRVVAAISKAVQSVPQPRVNPPNGYFIRSQRFSALIRDDTVDTVAFDTQLQSLMPLVPDMIASWVAACNGKLLDLLGSDREGDPHLELSTTFFKCGRCNDPISYPRILMHSCLRDTPRGTIVENLNGAGTTQDEDEEEEDNEESDELDNEAEELHVQPIREQITPERVWNQILSWYNAADWNEGGDQVFVDDEATGVANIIVKVCGEDPATATVSRMDSNDSRLECLRCCRSYKSKPSKRLIMNWKTAILHDIDSHYQDPPSETGWKLITDEVELTQIKQAESKSLRGKSLRHACRHCDMHITQDITIFHIKTSHRTIEIDWSEEGKEEFLRQHAYVPLDTPIARIPPFAVNL